MPLVPTFSVGTFVSEVVKVPVFVIPHAVETDATSRADNHGNYCRPVTVPTRCPVGGATGLQYRDRASISAA